MSGQTVMTFTTTVSTNLNILFVGDSISQQFAQEFFAAVLGEEHDRSHAIIRSFINGQVFDNSGLHVCSSLVTPARGRGVSAYWCVLALMSNRTEAPYYVNCKNENFWVGQDGKKLAEYRYPYPCHEATALLKMNSSKNNRATTWYRTANIGNGTRSQELHHVGGFNCCVLRPQHGWMELREITRERIVEEIELCNRVVGARTAILTTLPLNNNVITPSDWEGIIHINEVMREIARDWQPPLPGDAGVHTVLVQEFGNFTNQILWWNAKADYDCICVNSFFKPCSCQCV